MTVDVRRRAGPLRAGDRPGDARRARHRVEDVLRLLDRVRRRAEHPHLPGLPRPARRAAGGQRGGDRVDDPDRAGAELLDRDVVPVRAEELLLPGHAEELPDLAVRRAAVRRRLPGRRGRRPDRTGSGSSGCTSRRTPARTPTSGTTGRIHGADYSLVDYNRAGIPLVEIVTKPVPGTGALAPEVARAYVTELRDILRTLGVSDVRMEQGSLRCDVNTSLNRPGEPSGAPAPRPRTSTRCARSSGRCARRCCGRPSVLDAGGSGSCRRPGTSTRRPATPVPAAARRRRPTTGTSPSPTWCRSRRTRTGSSGCAPTLPELPAARRGPAARRARRQRRGHAADGQRRRGRPRRRHRRRRRAGRPRRATGGWATSPQQANEREIDAGRAADHAGPGRPAHRAGRATARCRRRSPRQAVDGVLETGEDVDAVVAERGLRVVSDTGALERGRRRRDRGQPGRRREGARRQGRRRSARSSAR